MNLIRIAANICLATNQSLALEIRNKLLAKILSLFPESEFDDKLYDTHESGKGFRPGYVSFALKPMDWVNNDLIGGILIRGEYPSVVVKSTSPEKGADEDYEKWVESGGNQGLKGGAVEVIELQAGYYNKKSSGSFQREQDLSQATFSIDSLENILDLELSDESKVRRALETIISDVLKNPPDLAISHRKKEKDNNFSSVAKFVKSLKEAGKNRVSEAEARQLAEATGENYFKLVERLRNVGISVR